VLRCEDTRLKNQLHAAHKQHKDICTLLQKAFITLYISLLGMGGTIYNNHTLEPFKELGLNSHWVKKLASKLHVHSVAILLNLSVPDAPFPVPLPTLIRSRFQVKPAILLIPIVLFLYCGGVTLQQCGSLSLLNVRSGLYCLHISPPYVQQCNDKPAFLLIGFWHSYLCAHVFY